MVLFPILRILKKQNSCCLPTLSLSTRVVDLTLKLNKYSVKPDSIVKDADVIVDAGLESDSHEGHLPL